MSDLVRLERPDFPSEVKLESEWIERRDKTLKSAEKFTGMAEMDSQDEFEEAEVLLSKITKISNVAEKKRKEYTKPFTDFGKQIKSMCDLGRADLEEAKLHLKKLMSGFVIKVEREAQEELERKASLIANSSFATTAPDVEAPSGEVFRTMTNVRKSLKFEVVDKSKVPREFLTVDETKIRRYIAANKEMSEIAGVRIYEDTDVQSR